MSTNDDRHWLLQAIELSRQCPPTDKAFSVGAIICGANNAMISSGFSREHVANEHAEEVAINKAVAQGKDLAGATIYTSLEPCHPRLSGKTSCSELIIYAGIKRVVFALYEPPVFVICKGTTILREHDIEVLALEDFADLVKEINKQILSKGAHF